MKSWEEFKLKIHAQIEVDQHELPAFLETASELRVKGLSEQDARMVSLVQPAARNLHQSSDLPEISRPVWSCPPSGGAARQSPTAEIKHSRAPGN